MSHQLQSGKRKKQNLHHETPKDGASQTPQTNPLLVEVIVEYIFKLIKDEGNVYTLLPYRLVCKLWDEEICKLTRHGTKVNLQNILLPYPKGIGWTFAKVKGESSFKYKVPYPHVRPFENVNLKEKDWKLQKSMGKWFQVMGSHVKTLGFEFSKVESKATRCCKVLENILKKWCPNLESLTFNGRVDIKYMIFASNFTNTSNQVVCKGLKEVKLCCHLYGDYTVKKINGLPTIFNQQFNKFVYQHGLHAGSIEFPVFQNHFGKKLEVPKEIFNSFEFPVFSELIPENFYPKMLDGGILGQIMSYTSVEKLSMLKCVEPENFGQVTAFFHIRPNCWRSSLRHLELRVSQMRKISEELIVLGKVKFPISTLKFTEDFDFEDPDSKTENMTRFLACFADTIQHLEYSASVNKSMIESTKLVLPVLPTLKTFIYQNYYDCPLCPLNILTSLPNLEYFYLKGYAFKAHDDFDHLTKISIFLDKDIGMVTHDKLKRVNITAALSASRAGKILNWFPTCERLTINIHDTDDDITTFFKHLATSAVTHLEIKLSRKTVDVGDALCGTSLIRDFKMLTNLKNLELQWETNGQTFSVLQSALYEGFGLLTQLQRLRLIKFGLSKYEKKVIRKCLPHISVLNFSPT